MRRAEVTAEEVWHIGLQIEYSLEQLHVGLDAVPRCLHGCLHLVLHPHDGVVLVHDLQAGRGINT